MKILLLGEMPFMAGYYRSISQFNGWSLDHIASDKPIQHLDGDYHLYILSDYPHNRFESSLENSILRQIHLGRGLIMVGGWSSFTGLDGEYFGTAIGNALPVSCMSVDDRVNDWQGFFLRPKMKHPILEGLDWKESPVIIGYNHVVPRAGSLVLIDASPLRPGFRLAQSDVAPILVAGKFGKGRICVYTSDLVPHWCGGLVDWGLPRISIPPFELGSDYIKFVSQMFTWTASQGED